MSAPWRTLLLMIALLLMAACTPAEESPPPATAAAAATDVPATAAAQEPDPTEASDPTEAPEPTAEPTSDAAELEPEEMERGIAVYQENGCIACHTLDAAGGTGEVGPTHEGLGATAAERIADPAYSGSATTAEEYIRGGGFGANLL
jgi:cytochrome c2